jgi:transcriptional regulator with XRE-family HTH domain
MDLTQEELAERLDVSSETISHFERGVTSPSLKTLITLAKLIKLDLPTVFSGMPGQGPRKVSADRADLEAKLRQIGLTWDDDQLRYLLDIARTMLAHAPRKPPRGGKRE